MNSKLQGLIPITLRWGILCLGLVLGFTAEAQRLRLVGGNISSGNNQNYDLGHGARIFKGLNPDVVMIQEFKYGSNSTADIRSFVTATFGSGFSYFRETGTGIPNGVISRYPILQSGEWDDPKVSDRDFSWARIDIPGPKDLWAVSVHFLTSGSSIRNEEANALVNYIRAVVPATDYLVIAGDFNSDTRSEAQFTTLQAVVETAGPHPADRTGNQNTNNPPSGTRAKPYDSVFADPKLRALQTPVIIGASTFENGLVADTRVYSPIAEISPALASDSGATNMQHMAIVKDFMLPAEPPVITSTSPLATGTIGTSLSRTFTATGGTAPYTWSITSGTAPAGLTLASGGLLSGTPTAAGSFTFTIQVVDSAAATSTKSFTIVLKEPLTLFLESYGLPANSAAIDSDRDGIANLIEFLLGGNPIQSDPAVLPKLGLNGQQATYSFSVRSSLGSAAWKPQSSPDLSTWTDIVPGTDGALIATTPRGETMKDVVVTLPASGGKRFVRLLGAAP